MLCIHNLDALEISQLIPLVVADAVFLWQTNGDIYEALRTIAACYVRADMSGICDCITAYKLTDVLSKATRLKRMQQALVEGCQGQNRPDEQGQTPYMAAAPAMKRTQHASMPVQCACQMFILTTFLLLPL